MENIKLIAFDLDDTLLNRKKELTPATFATLEKASSMGIAIVPVTGRFFNAVPENVKSLKFVRYMATLNGAEIYDMHTQKSIASFTIPPELAITIARVCEGFLGEGAIYDAIVDSHGYMTQICFDRIPDCMMGPWQVDLVANFRTPVDDIMSLIAKSSGIQKMQIYTLNKELRANLLQALPVVFPKCFVTSAIKNNIEINYYTASKGQALKFIAEHLGLSLENALAFGDGTNDASMIKAAKIGVAMENAADELKKVADYITSDCDNDGVAEGIKKFCFGQSE